MKRRSVKHGERHLHEAARRVEHQQEPWRGGGDPLENEQAQQSPEHRRSLHGFASHGFAPFDEYWSPGILLHLTNTKVTSTAGIIPMTTTVHDRTKDCD